MRKNSKKKDLGGRPPVSDAEKRRRGTLRSYNSAAARARRRGGKTFRAPPAPKWFTAGMRKAYAETWERSLAARPVETAAEARERGLGLLRWVRFEDPGSDAAPSFAEWQACGFEPDEFCEWLRIMNGSAGDA